MRRLRGVFILLTGFIVRAQRVDFVVDVRGNQTDNVVVDVVCVAAEPRDTDVHGATNLLTRSSDRPKREKAALVKDFRSRVRDRYRRRRWICVADISHEYEICQTFVEAVAIAAVGYQTWICGITSVPSSHPCGNCTLPETELSAVFEKRNARVFASVKLPHEGALTPTVVAAAGITRSVHCEFVIDIKFVKAHGVAG